jgi:hypothetical protein
VQGNIDLEALLAANPNEHTNLKYQMSWPGGGDPYFTAEGDTRKTYYTATGVPHLVIDGFGPDGIAKSVLSLSKKAKSIQTGYIYHYAFAILIGVSLFITYFIYRNL